MQYESKNVICPFYIESSGQTIKCEGIFSKICVNKFFDENNKKTHFKRFCCNSYKNCPLEKILEKKYDSAVTC